MKKGMFKFVGGLFLILILATVGYGAVEAYQVYHHVDKSYQELKRGTKSEKRETAVKITEDPVSVLLLGVENYATNGVGGRADSIMVATIQPKTKTVKMVSIPRDTYVNIPGHGYTKINHSYAYGGKDLTIQTVENFLNLPIDYYVQVDFKGFKNIINELGGVDVQVPFDFAEQSDEARRQLYFKKGPATLDGEHALAYARMRHHDPRGDFGRADRQKEVVISLAEKLMSPKYWWKLGDVASHIADYTNTNIHVQDALNLATTYRGLTKDQVEILHVNGKGKMIKGIYYFEADPQSVKTVQETLNNHLKGIEDEASGEKGADTQDNGETTQTTKEQ